MSSIPRSTANSTTSNTFGLLSTDILRRTVTKYSFAEIEATIIAGLEPVNLRTIQRSANRTCRWIDAWCGSVLSFVSFGIADVFFGMNLEIL
jgi:hypothetical protein